MKIKSSRRSAFLAIFASLFLFSLMAAGCSWGVAAQVQPQMTAPGVQTTTPAPSGAAAQPPISAALPRTITVVGENTINIEPNIARATIGVETSAVTVRDAIGQAAAVMQQVLAALAGAGIAPGDIQTASYSVWTERNGTPQSGPGQPDSYRVNNNVTVTIRALDQVSNVLDAAVEGGANQIFGVSFGVDDPASLEAQAAQKAVSNAREKAQMLAAQYGLQLGPVMSVSEVVGVGGGTYDSLTQYFQTPPGMGSGGAGPVAPGELSITKRIEVTYALQ